VLQNTAGGGALGYAAGANTVALTSVTGTGGTGSGGNMTPFIVTNYLIKT
jgi:hypothetical protein